MDAVSLVMERPPYQLIKQDRYNLAPGVVLVFLLAACKDLKVLPTLVRWQLCAYTNWNLALISLGTLLQQKQWEPFLCINSVGLNIGFRTAMAQGLADNMRKKIEGHGLALPRAVFNILDHVVHTLPAVVLMAKLVHEKRRIGYLNCMYALILSTYFAFRQSAKLDGSSIYVPHPWTRAWFGILVGIFATPFLADALIDRDAKKSLLAVFLLFVPWCTTRFDPNLRQEYMFEYHAAVVGTPQEQGKRNRAREPQNSPKGVRRIQSEL